MSINDQQWELVGSMYWNLMLPIHFSSLRICKTCLGSHRCNLLALLGWIWALDVISAITFMNEAPKSHHETGVASGFCHLSFTPKSSWKVEEEQINQNTVLLDSFFPASERQKTCHVYVISNTWHEHHNLYHNLTNLQLVCHKETSDYLMATSHFNKIPQPSGLLYRKKIAQIAHPGGPAKRSTCHVRKFVLKVDWHQSTRKCM